MKKITTIILALAIMSAMSTAFGKMRRHHHNNTNKQKYHCKLPNGNTDKGKTEEDCKKVNGKWVKG